MLINQTSPRSQISRREALLNERALIMDRRIWLHDHPFCSGTEGEADALADDYDAITAELAELAYKDNH